MLSFILTRRGWDALKVALFLVLTVLVGMPAEAHKFSLPSCVPKTVYTPNAAGSKLVPIDYPGVVMHGWTCNGKIYVHVDATGRARPTAALAAAASASSPETALPVLMKAMEVEPANDDQHALWMRAHYYGVLFMRDYIKLPTHAVAPLTGSTERPARKVVNAALVTYATPARVPIGTDCDLTVLPTFASGNDVWAAVVGQPADLRWLCRKK